MMMMMMLIPEAETISTPKNGHFQAGDAGLALAHNLNLAIGRPNYLPIIIGLINFTSFI